MTIKQLQALYKSYDKTFKRLSKLRWELYNLICTKENQDELNGANAEFWSSRRTLLKHLDPKMGELMREEIEKMK